MGECWLCSLVSALTLPSCSTEAARLGPASGLLVDWLETLDPEVVCSCPDLQWKLLFSRRKVTGTWPSVPPQCCHSRLCLIASRGVRLARPRLPDPGNGACLFGSTLEPHLGLELGWGEGGIVAQILTSEEPT